MEELEREVFIPIQISTRKGRRACTARLKDAYAVTPLSKLLTKAYIMQKRMLENPNVSQREFCELNKISPRYYGRYVDDMLITGDDVEHISHVKKQLGEQFRCLIWVLSVIS